MANGEGGDGRGWKESWNVRLCFKNRMDGSQWRLFGNLGFLAYLEGENEIVEQGSEIIVVLLLLKRSIPKYTSNCSNHFACILSSPNPVSLHHTIPALRFSSDVVE